MLRNLGTSDNRRQADDPAHGAKVFSHYEPTTGATSISERLRDLDRGSVDKEINFGNPIV